MKIVIWLDDQRNPEEFSWKKYIQERLAQQVDLFSITPRIDYKVVWVKTAKEFKEVFGFYAHNSEHTIHAVFFDYQLDWYNSPFTGWDAFRWMFNYVKDHGLKPFELYCQSGHPEGKRKIHRGMNKLEAYWQILKATNSSASQNL